MAMKMGSVKIPDEQIERTGYIELSECCDVKGHEKVNMIHFHGEIICPRCFLMDKGQEFAYKKTSEHFDNTAEGRRLFFYKNSIVHNKIILDKGIRDYTNKNDAESYIKKQANQAAHDVIADSRNVFMYGGAGTGKSHLLVGILKNINELSTEKRCLFVSVPKLLSNIKKSFNDPTELKGEAYYMKLLSDADVLGLDDIGAELSMNTTKQATDFTINTLYNVLNAREGKSTLFTSNLTIEQLSKLMDERIISRIRTNVIYMDFNNISDKREIAYKLKQ
ncbi:DnaA ATPase domain-containing protein [Vagococcus carniphilus]|uniref:DnaA ATPase domain-containing protein n=1 Tax=Vagococcus carniphilus TaxID=218144 RepID=UPI002891D2FB|nr:DnaA/Hda family protein [Vagococcus carniphilus]MDT2864278.1 DnaA/Hda family protein [Vagococcus carniphilus]